MNQQSGLPQGELAIGPVELVVLQSTSFCNLDCSYCYLTPESRRNRKRLPIPSLKRIFDNILSSRYVGSAMQVSWHSGEPLVLPPAYYAEAIDTILSLKDDHCRSHLDMRFEIQTNGTLIDQEWCELFRKYRKVLAIGVSCDGPAFLHDLHRRDWAGRPSHERTCRGIELLRDNGLEFDLIAVLSPQSLEHPDAFLGFFNAYKDHVREFHFNLLDELQIDAGEHRARNAYAREYYEFLTALLNAVGEADAAVSVRNFTSFYRRLFAGEQVKQVYDARNMSRPLRALNVEANGDVSTFYAGLTADASQDLYGDGRGLVVGNLLKQQLEEIASSSKLRRIARDFEISHRACEARCDYYALCSGGYNLVKHKRFGTFDATETPECLVHVKTFAQALLDHINRNVNAAHAGRSGRTS